MSLLRPYVAPTACSIAPKFMVGFCVFLSLPGTLYARKLLYCKRLYNELCNCNHNLLEVYMQWLDRLLEHTSRKKRSWASWTLMERMEEMNPFSLAVMNSLTMWTLRMRGKMQRKKCKTIHQIPYGRKFWRGIHFGGLVVLRAICQYFIRQNFSVLSLSVIIDSTCTIGLQLGGPV